MAISSQMLTFLFFITMSFYITNHNDGTCEAIVKQSACLAKDSPFGTNRGMCEWLIIDQPSNTGYCSYRQPDQDLLSMLNMLIFSALLTVPIALLTTRVISSMVYLELYYGAATPSKVLIPASVTSQKGSSTKQVLNILPEGNYSSSSSAKDSSNAIKSSNYSVDLNPVSQFVEDVMTFRQVIPEKDKFVFDSKCSFSFCVILFFVTILFTFC